MWTKGVSWYQLDKSGEMGSCDYGNDISDLRKSKDIFERLCSVDQTIDTCFRISQNVIAVFVTTANVCCLYDVTCLIR
jgi:hypothetical protein